MSYSAGVMSSLRTARWVGTVVAALLLAVLIGMPDIAAAKESAAAAAGGQGGCTLITDPADKARCQGEQRAREEVTRQAQAELRKGAEQALPDGHEIAGNTLTEQWDRAKDEAKGYGGDLFSARLLALIVGLVWFWTAFKRQRRRTRRRAR